MDKCLFRQKSLENDNDYAPLRDENTDDVSDSDLADSSIHSNFKDSDYKKFHSGFSARLHRFDENLMKPTFIYKYSKARCVT